MLADVQMQGAMQESGVPPELGQTNPKDGPCQSRPPGLSLQGNLDSQAGTAVNEGSGCRVVNHLADWGNVVESQLRECWIVV